MANWKKTALELAQEREREGLLSTRAQEGIKKFESEQWKGSVQKKLWGVQVPETEAFQEQGLKQSPDLITPETQDNIETNRLIDQWLLPESQREDQPQQPSLEPVWPTVEDFAPEIKVPEPVTTVEPTQTTGIEPVDLELDKLREEKEKRIEDEYDSYNIAKGQFEAQKDYYTNFDDVNTKYEWVLADLRQAQMDTETDLTPEQLQKIATKYGVSVEEVQNPTTLFDNLDFSDKWRQELGVETAEKQIDKITIDFERRKEDLAFQLEGQKETARNQMDDAAKQAGRNISFAEAQGAFTGASRSSWYNQGIENMKQDADTITSRMQSALDRTNEAYDTNIQRLSDDYEISMGQAKQELDSQLKNLRHDNWLKLSWATEEYWLGSDKLTKALDAINEEFWTKSQDVFNKYLSNMKSIQSITNTNIDQQERIIELLDKKQNERYNALLANDWVLLTNTSLNTLLQSQQNGELSVERFNDLKWLMTNSVVQTLSQYGVVNTADLNTITTLMSQGQTPTQIVAKMQEMNKFQPEEEDKYRAPIKVKAGETLFDPTSGTFKTVPTDEVSDLTSFIKWEEWFRTEAYLDSAWVPTIGYWFTSVNGVPVKLWDTITQEQSEQELQRQIQRHSNYEAVVTVPLSNAQKTALSSFEYNLWPNIWKWDGKGIIDMINDGNLQWAADLMLKFNKARDPETDELRVLRWLENRRSKEANLLLQSDAQVSGYDESDAPLYKKYNEGKFTSSDYKNLTTPVEEFKQKANNYKVELSKQGQWQITKLLGLINNLKTKPWRTWAALWTSRIPFTNAADYQADFDAFVSNTALDNLISTKAQGATFGALSNQELNFIKDAATSLKLNMSDEAYNAELDRMEELLRKWLTEETEVVQPAQWTWTTIQSRWNDLFNKYKR